MITKKDFAEAILNKALSNERMKEFHPSIIISSSSAAVAAEYLGLLVDECDKEYASTREGVLFCGVNNENEPVVISTRYILNSLPEEKQCKEKSN